MTSGSCRRHQLLLLTIAVSAPFAQACAGRDAPVPPPRAVVRVVTGTPGGGLRPLAESLAELYQRALPNVSVTINDNAIRYSPGDRSIHISASCADGGVVLNVSDCSRGIPQDEIDQVTRKFFRGRAVGPNGSGLGLVIVKRIVEDHRGRLKITSRAGAGTTVGVTLPIDDQA